MARELCLPSFHVETQSGVRSLVLRGVAYRINFVDSETAFSGMRRWGGRWWYSQEQLFNVVLAVDLYHGFVPWCQRSEVLKEYPDGSFDAELEIGFKFLVESYISHVEFERPKWIKTTARDTGLFDHLINLWQFKPGPIPGTCDLSILVDFKFNSPLYRQVASMFLKEVATRLMGAFSDRCRLVYGPGVRVDENAFEQRA
ncbi:unnamed protein product [Brassica oleracea var. botrytis]